MMAFDFSKYSKREKKIYSFSDVTLSRNGISTRLILIAAILIGVSLCIHIPICMALGNWYISPFTEDGDIVLTGLVVTVGIPIGIAVLLYNCKVQQYRLIDFIWLYFKPKKEIAASGTPVRRTAVKFRAFMEKQKLSDSVK